MPRPPTDLSNELLFSVCEKLLRGERAQDVANFIAAEINHPFSRQQVYHLLERAAKAGLLSLIPKTNETLAQQIAEKYDIPRNQIEVIEATGSEVVEQLARKAAQKAFESIAEIRRKKGPEPIHVGLGFGRTTRLVCKTLGALLKSQLNRPGRADEPERHSSIPQLEFHALTGGWEPENPLDSPIAQFNYFIDEDRPYARFMGLSAPPVVKSELYDQIKGLPFVERCFTRAQNLDVVITSIGSRDDEHSSFTRLMVTDKERKKLLDDVGWVGDIQSLPYSRRGPITIKEGLCAMVIVSLADLVQMARTKLKSVVLPVGPCGLCNATKASALLPLLTVPELRVFTHLIVDVKTAKELYELGKPA